MKEGTDKMKEGRGKMKEGQTKPMKTVAYLRVSTMEQASGGHSLSAQEDRIRNYCNVRGLNLAEIFIDRGVSAGKPLNTRPEGSKLLAAIECGEIEAVVAFKLDRLFRDVRDCLSNIGDWDALGIALHLVDQGGSSMDTQSALGRFFLTIMAAFAEMERNIIADRVRTVVAYKKAKGERIGTIPYGSKLAIDDKTLEPDDREIRILEQIQLMSAQGHSIRGIAKRLNAMGVPARGKRWHKTSVHRFLTKARKAEAADDVTTDVADPPDAS